MKTFNGTYSATWPITGSITLKRKQGLQPASTIHSFTSIQSLAGYKQTLRSTWLLLHFFRPSVKLRVRGGRLLLTLALPDSRESSFTLVVP